MHHDHLVHSIEQLDVLYGAPSDQARSKHRDHLDAACRRFIAASPFMLFASCGSGGMDCSPRGDQPGFVAVADDRTLLIPDRRGNNRIDSLRNVIDNPRVGLLFLIPGMNECLRVNGSAQISTDPDLLSRFLLDGIAPKTVLVVNVEQAFAQCSRAILRAGLWPTDVTTETAAGTDLGALLDAHHDGLAETDAQAALLVARTQY